MPTLIEFAFIVFAIALLMLFVIETFLSKRAYLKYRKIAEEKGIIEDFDYFVRNSAEFARDVNRGVPSYEISKCFDRALYMKQKREGPHERQALSNVFVLDFKRSR